MDELALKTTLLAQTHTHIVAQTEILEAQLTYALDQYFKTLVTKQEGDVSPIHAIHISFLYTSLYFKKPEFQLDAYGEFLYFEPSYLTAQFKADWLFKYWEEYETNLASALKSIPQTMYRPGQMYKISYGSVKNLLYYIYTSFKYIFRACETLESFQKLKKAHGFYISFGEYRDWQRPIYMHFEPLDLFNCMPDVVRRYHIFKQSYYKDKAFLDWDLYSSQFQACRFQKTQFIGTQLNDVRFTDCIFENVVFEKVSLYGITFENCTFNHVTFIDCVLGIHGLPPEAIKEIYKPGEWLDCRFESCMFEKCNLSFNQIIPCHLENVEVKASICEASDFEKGGK